MIEVSEITMNDVAGLAPKVTLVAPVKLLPIIVTTTPPAILPEAGVIPVTTGTGAAMYVN